MKDLIEALTIFAKYTEDAYPTHCEHDVLYVLINPTKVHADDLARLEQLSFTPDTETGDCFKSFRFGSA